MNKNNIGIWKKKKIDIEEKSAYDFKYNHMIY